jgi:8-oxo-dGTP pyrophosphatase MutT (NUDIX family)
MRTEARTASVLQLAQKAFIVRDDRILLVQKDAADPEQPNTWEVPGGRLSLEEDLDEHIRREVFEEVGLHVTPGPPFAMWDWLMAGRGEHKGATVRVIAIARRCEASGNDLDYSHRTDDDFLGEARWVPMSEVSEYPLIPSLIPAMRSFLAAVLSTT